MPRYLRGERDITRADTESLIARINGRWETHGLGFRAVAHKTGGELIGHSGPKPLDTTAEIEVAYALAKSYWGQGFATEAARAAMRFGFEHLNLDRIVAVAVPENLASQRVMIKLVTTYEKIARYDDDLAAYSISRAAFQPGASPVGGPE